MDTFEMSPLIPSTEQTGKQSNNTDSAPDQGEDQGWQLQKLKPKHKEICSLLAQGLGRNDISKIVDVTPEYVTMLMKQPLIKEYMGEMAQLAGIQLESMFIKSVDTIGEVMTTGNNKEKIQAARLQLEATKRIGTNSGLPKEVIDSAQRLDRLSERLLKLLPEKRQKTIDLTEDENGTYKAS